MTVGRANSHDRSAGQLCLAMWARSAERGAYGTGWTEGATKYGRPHIEQASLSVSEVRSVVS